MSNLSAAERVYQRWGYPLPPLAGADDGTPAPAAEPSPTVAQPVPAAPAPTAPPAAPVTPSQPAAQSNPGPWAADLERFFPDETSRQAADRFMREHVQPARTQLEQELAPARALYEDLLSNPRETLAAIAGELFADEDSEYHDASLAEQLSGIFGSEQPPAQETPLEGQLDEITLDKLPPELREMYEEHAAQKQTAEYNRVVDGFIEQSENLTPQDKDPLRPWISATGGDLQAAEQAYLNYRQQLLEQAGVQPTTPVPPAPVVGGEAVTPSGAPPATQQYTRWEDLDKAVDDYSAEQRRGPVPPVGAV